jgi:N,N-dimethylformamidase
MSAAERQAASAAADRTVIGYPSSRFVLPGDEVEFMLHCEQPEFRASLVRLVDAESASGRPHVEHELEHQLTGLYDGFRQVTPMGSFIAVADVPDVRAFPAVSFGCWIWPTTPVLGRHQGIIALPCGEGGERLAISLDGIGHLVLGQWLGTQLEPVVIAGTPVNRRRWAFVGASCDLGTGTASVWVFAEADLARAGRASRAFGSFAGTVPRTPPAQTGSATLAAVDHLDSGPQAPFNGKLEAPTVWTAALSATAQDELAQGRDPHLVARDVVWASWDLAPSTSDLTHVSDRGPHKRHGVAHQMPSRGVTGRRWTGDEDDFRRAPAHYAAMHFHDDDLADAMWRPSVSLRIPSDWSSGIYALRVQVEDVASYVPFLVGARRARKSRRPPTRIAVLMPTMTYLAYANSQVEARAAENGDRDGRFEQVARRFTREHVQPSLYDRHRDGSPVYFATRRQAIIELQPDYRFWQTGLPRHFSLDLAISGWLNRGGFAHHILCDELLDRKGPGALTPYSVVLTGCHPEYVTPHAREALRQYVTSGGRLMYLGGNGLYWSVSLLREQQHVLELRRGHGGSSGGAETAAGEEREIATGHLGGLWRYRGRGPHGLLGVGTTAIGYSRGAPYRVTGEGPDWIQRVLRGAASNGLIGEATSGSFGGAAGDEVDRHDHQLGTPPEAVVVATSAGLHAPDYLCAKEDFDVVPPALAEHPDLARFVRADMTLLQAETGGAVFSAGSLVWSLGLLRESDDASVDLVTRGVLERFLDPTGWEADHSAEPTGGDVVADA